MNKQNSTIVIKTSSNTFTYDIIQVGIYPDKDILAYTLRPNQYRILHDYIVKTTFGHSHSQKTITSVVRAMDIKKVLQNAYQLLVAIEYDLLREWAVFAMQQQINFQISKYIPIHLIDLNLSLLVFQNHSEDSNEETNIETINNTEII
ncbi:8961_t:CDS:2 [Cetraspora pellucida]|uniref:8961_t:CDS:1 n=1 Tax=Cetraspora pellucida TaxID=1433469 RepID=A0ACA9KPX4_9GLOM|nr:8961_t:CDS:2 [Cetraspora pellucida]